MDKDGVFGKDLGLIHEVVCAGRRLGADHNFWNFLAYDKGLYAKVVETVKKARLEWLKVSAVEIETIRNWLLETERTDCPYPEDETYYTRSSHSAYEHYFGRLHSEAFGEIFRKASQSKEVANLCRLVEAVFVISYLLSGYYSAEQDPDGTKKDWMHGPFSIDVYLDDIWDGDLRVSLGNFLRREDLHAIAELGPLRALASKALSDKSNVTSSVICLREVKARYIKLARQELARFSA